MIADDSARSDFFCIATIGQGIRDGSGNCRHRMGAVASLHPESMGNCDAENLASVRVLEKQASSGKPCSLIR